MVNSKVLEELKREEGFSGTVYQDHLGFDTVGYGTKMPLTEYEATLLLENRYASVVDEVGGRLGHLEIEEAAWDIIYAMAYQMGVGGLMKFKNMIKALEVSNYKRASVEMLDSKWSRQTPERARRMACMMAAV